MKLALITDPSGFGIIEALRLTYHLPLAQQVLADDRYERYYKTVHQKGDFLIMDNGVAEGITLSATQLFDAANRIKPDEIILPDVMRDMDATIKSTINPKYLNAINPIHRAVVPQGNNAEEWFACANYFVNHLDFTTICIPKHCERFQGGRAHLLNTIAKAGWHKHYHIHLLGVWDNPLIEVILAKAVAPWIRGIDTAAPFALAQNGVALDKQTTHISHAWGVKFSSLMAERNATVLYHEVTGGEEE